MVNNKKMVMQTPCLLVAINAKYVHTNLAVRSLRTYLGSETQILEYPMQEPIHKLAQRIFTRAPANALVGFSCYLWNIAIVERLCERLKKMRGDIRIVLGGPEVSYDAADVLRRNPAVDYVVSGEGEVPLLALAQGGALPIPGLYAQSGVSCPGAQPPPLGELPFAYADGIDALKGRIIYYETSRGCPFGCRFCLSAGANVRYLPLKRALDELSFFAGRNVRQVKLVDRTFNADPARARKIWEHLITLRTNTNFHFEIAAHLLSEEDFSLLAHAPEGRFQFEIGVQSTYAPAREAVHRAEPLERVKYAVRRLRENGNIHLHLDLIAGLPLESFERFGQSYDEIHALNPHALQLGILKALKGSGVREDAAKYGLKFSQYPPYDVLATNALSASDVVRLSRMADIASRFVESGRAEATVALLRNAFGPFALLAALEAFLDEVPKEPEAILGSLAAFARENGFAGVDACLERDRSAPVRPRRR